jgi:hypothetical protein
VYLNDTMVSVTAERRVVLSCTSEDFGRHGVYDWVPPTEKIQTHNNFDFVAVGYHCDRGFARFLGADMKESNPLKNYTWLNDAIQMRSHSVNQLLERVATDKLLNHVAGSPVKQRGYLADFLPKFVEITAPAITFEGTTLGPCTFKVITEVYENRQMSIESTAFAYVRHAMRASVGVEVTRARPSHDARLSASTGVKGVTKVKRNRVEFKFQNDDGKVQRKSIAINFDASPDHVADMCQRLKRQQTVDNTYESTDPLATTANSHELAADTAETADGDASAVAAHAVDDPPEKATPKPAVASTLDAFFKRVQR